MAKNSQFTQRVDAPIPYDMWRVRDDVKGYGSGLVERKKWVVVPGGTLAVPSTYSISERSLNAQLDPGDTLQPPLLPDTAAFDQWLFEPAGDKTYEIKASYKYSRNDEEYEE